MLNLIDEYTRERLAIRPRPRLNSRNVIEVLPTPWSSGIPEHIRSDNWSRVRWQGSSKVAPQHGGGSTVHRTGLALGDWLLRELQFEAARCGFTIGLGGI